ncbi:MAG: ATP-binding cassette domain-containing protein [Alicyclobacillus shizuokensis]|nr:ATP-binding cassette domain-containing protein [Alicyclobacillus shizuokensis]
MEPLIAVEDLVKQYRKAKQPAVKGISFQVQPGEFFALLGPNGAGKTTTISIHHHAGQDQRSGADSRVRPGHGGKASPPKHRHHFSKSESRSHPVGRGKHPLARMPLRALSISSMVPPDAGGVSSARQRVGGDGRTGRSPVQASENLFWRHEAEARDYTQPHAQAAGAVSGRAHLGLGRGQPPFALAVPARDS